MEFVEAEDYLEAIREELPYQATTGFRWSPSEQWLGKGAQQHSYSLEEFGKLIGPTYQVYEEYIRRCVAGLTTVAAQWAARQQEEDILKLREIILKMVPFWGLDGGAYADKETARQMKQQYCESFDQAVSAARQSGQAPSLPDSARQEILIALEIHRQELENDGELDDWAEECMTLKEQLQLEWQMETDMCQRSVSQMEGMSL